MCGCESWTIKKPELLLKCGAQVDSWESLGRQGDQTSQSYRKSTLNIHRYGFPGGPAVKNPPQCRRPRFSPCVRKIPWGGHGSPLQYSCLENPMDRGAWRATVHGGRTGLDMIEATCTAHPLVGLKLKLQHFGHLMQRADSLERPWFWERPKAGGEGDGRGWDGWMASPTQQTWVWANSGR